MSKYSLTFKKELLFPKKWRRKITDHRSGEKVLKTKYHHFKVDICK